MGGGGEEKREKGEEIRAVEGKENGEYYKVLNKERDTDIGTFNGNRE